MRLRVIHLILTDLSPSCFYIWLEITAIRVDLETGRVLIYRDILSGSSWLSLSSCHGTQSRRRMARCIRVFSAWCRWSRMQSMRSRQPSHSRIHPLEGSREVDTQTGSVHKRQDRPSGYRHHSTLTYDINVSHGLLWLSLSDTESWSSVVCPSSTTTGACQPLRSNVIQTKITSLSLCGLSALLRVVYLAELGHNPVH